MDGESIAAWAARVASRAESSQPQSVGGPSDGSGRLVGSELDGVRVRRARRLARGLLEESSGPRVLTLRDRGVLDAGVGPHGQDALEDADVEEWEARERRKLARRSRAEMAALGVAGILPQYDEDEVSDDGQAKRGGDADDAGSEEDLVLGRGGDFGEVHVSGTEARVEQWDGDDGDVLERPMLGKRVAMEFLRNSDASDGQSGRTDTFKRSDGAKEWRRGTLGAKRGRRFLRHAESDDEDDGSDGVLAGRSAVAEENFRKALEVAEKKSAEALRRRPAALSVLSLARRVEEEKKRWSTIEESGKGGRNCDGGGVVISSAIDFCRDLERSAAAADAQLPKDSALTLSEKHSVSLLPATETGHDVAVKSEPLGAPDGVSMTERELGVDIDLGGGLAAALALLQKDGAIVKEEPEPLFLRLPLSAPTGSIRAVNAAQNDDVEEGEDAREVSAMKFPELSEDIVRRDKIGRALTPKEAYLDLSRRLDRTRAWNKRRVQQRSTEPPHNSQQ